MDPAIARLQAFFASIGVRLHLLNLIEMRAALLRRQPGPQSARRDNSAFGDERSGSNDGALADTRAVEDDGAHANETGVFNDAAMDGGVVADSDPIAHDDRPL